MVAVTNGLTTSQPLVEVFFSEQMSFGVVIEKTLNASHLM
jgi:hypothetical protein